MASYGSIPRSDRRSRTSSERSDRSSAHAGTPAHTARRVSHVSLSGAALDDLGSSHSSDDHSGMSSRDKKFIVITFSLVNFGLGAFYSVLGPFFPNEAVKKGMSVTTTGLVFGIFELIVVAMSPIFGKFITHLGAKFLYCSGIIVCGLCSVMFGFLDRCPDGAVYVVMCFIVRSVEGLGAAACLTASFAIMAKTFPKNISTMFGTLELFTGLGLMAGPPIGGALFQWGGFSLPFVVTGGVMAAIGFLSICLLPSIQDLQPSGGGIMGLLRIPLVTIMCFYLLVGAAAIGFIDVGLSLFLQEVYGFSALIISVIFLAMPGLYTITAPIWGVIADKKPQYNFVLLVLGYMLGGVSFFFLGPAPFFGIANNYLWLTILCLMLAGFGVGTLIISFQVINEATLEGGYPESLQTYGLISGLFNSFFSLGAFIGPLVGGYLIDSFAFPTASVFMGGTMIFIAVFLAIFTSIVKCRSGTDPQGDCEETTRLSGNDEHNASNHNSVVVT